MELEVKLEAFEGPLDLLLHLIEKNKIDIYDIPIAEITDQYIAYVRKMQEEDLDVMSEFLVMAATLLDIKARMLLPKEQKDEDEEEEDPREELVHQLLEYKMYKYMSYELKDRQMDGQTHMFGSPAMPEEVLSYREPVDLDELTAGLDLSRLHKIYESVIRRQNEKVDPIRSRFGKIRKEEVSLEEKASDLDRYARTHRNFAFHELFGEHPSRVEVIVTFLAILEDMKTGKILITQEHLFDEIQIESRIYGQQKPEQESTQELQPA